MPLPNDETLIALGEEILTEFEKIFGPHPGFRPAHAKGTMLAHSFHLGRVALIGICVVALLLLYEHLIVSPKDIRRMNAAFFTLNGIISIVFFGFIATDVLLRR